MTVKIDSWWNDTPWPEIEAYVKATLSSREFKGWLKRPDVIDRAKRTDLTDDG